MKIDRFNLVHLFPDVFDVWDWQRRRENYFAGLSFFTRASGRRNFTLASRHWPHHCCWAWSLSFDADFSGRQPFRFQRNGGVYRARSGYFGFWRFTYRWQDYRLAAPGTASLECEAFMRARLDLPEAA